ncbi:MAG: ABC transporter substrate-binding protein [Proteobacteria bacterium]|nr:ABC transporter substrate-binding protein [Pseudomonadota bacterium]
MADDLLKIAVGQRGRWDSSVAELGANAGIFALHGLTLRILHTSGGGETQQAVFSGSVDIGIGPGTRAILGAYAEAAPVRIIAGATTGVAEYFFVTAASAIGKDFAGIAPANTVAFSTNGSATHVTALHFKKTYGFRSRLVATGSVQATFAAVMVGKIDVGYATPPFGLDAVGQGKIRIIALGNDLTSVRTQTMRVIIANAKDMTRRRTVHERFIRAYREVIDWMYADDAALDAFARHAKISMHMARQVRDRFYPKSMLQLEDVGGIDVAMQDALTLKYLRQELSQRQLDELLQLPGHR